MAKKNQRSALWGFVFGGVVGGALAYLARGELERFIAAIQNKQAARARLYQYR